MCGTRFQVYHCDGCCFVDWPDDSAVADTKWDRTDMYGQKRGPSGNFEKDSWTQIFEVCNEHKSSDILERYGQTLRKNEAKNLSGMRLRRHDRGNPRFDGVRHDTHFIRIVV